LLGICSERSEQNPALKAYGFRRSFAHCVRDRLSLEMGATAGIE
jgi:hypothetical protein